MRVEPRLLPWQGNSPSGRGPPGQASVRHCLFAAADAGATRTRIRKATGLKPAAVKAALAAAGLSAETRSAHGETEAQLSLEQLAVIAEFQDDPGAVTWLTQAARHDEFDHAAENLRQKRAGQAEHEQLHAGLEAAGYVVTDGFPHGATILSALLHDGQEVTPRGPRHLPGPRRLLPDLGADPAIALLHRRRGERPRLPAQHLGRGPRDRACSRQLAEARRGSGSTSRPGPAPGDRG